MTCLVPLLFLLCVLLFLSCQCDARAFDAGGAPFRPKVMIITMFDAEANVWFNIPEFDVLARNVTFPGLSPLFPAVHCTADCSVCLATTGQAEINAASTMSALLFAGPFDLTSTYFLIAGIAGVNPKAATIGAVTFARYAVQVGLQYEFDAREVAEEFSTGYFAQGARTPGQLPGWWYGTEVFEVNDALRQIAFGYAQTAVLSDTADAQGARGMYGNLSVFAAGATRPGVVLCDTATSDTYWSGDLLGEAFENTTKVFTNGTGEYCTTQQEDNATLNVLMRAALCHLVDFGRIIIMRSASDFDRPHPGQDGVTNLLGPAPGFTPALLNLHLAGAKVVEGILAEWDSRFAKGIKATNYIGDVFGTLGGSPDFGH